MQVWKQTFSIFMASSVLWMEALKLDSLTGNEITDSQEEEELKKIGLMNQYGQWGKAKCNK